MIEKIPPFVGRGIVPLPVIPTEYTDALSYGEQVGTMIHKLDETVDKVNEVVDDNNEFKTDLTEQQNDFETDITNQQSSFETAITNQQNTYEQTTTQELNNWKTDTTNGLNTWKTNTKDEYQLQIDGLEQAFNELEQGISIDLGIESKYGSNDGLAISQVLYTKDVSYEIPFNYYDHGFINSEGGISSIADFEASCYLNVDMVKGVVTTLLTNCYLAFYDEDKVFISGVTETQSVAEAEPKYYDIDTLKPVGTKYLRFSCYTNFLSSVRIYGTMKNNTTLNYDIVVPKMKDGYFLNADGEERPLSGYSVSDYISTKNLLYVNCNMLSNMCICEYDEFDRLIGTNGGTSNYFSGIYYVPSKNVAKIRITNVNTYTDLKCVYVIERNVTNNYGNNKGLSIAQDVYTDDNTYEIPFNYYNGGFINYQGNISQISDFQASCYLDVAIVKGIVTTLLTNCYLAFYDEDKVFISGVTETQTVGEAEPKYYDINTIKPNGAKYLRFSCYTNFLSSVKIYGTMKKNALVTYETITPTMIDGFFLNSSGMERPFSGYSISDYLSTDNLLYVCCSMIANMCICEYDDGGNLISTNGGTNIFGGINYVPSKNAKWIRITNDNNFSGVKCVYTKEPLTDYSFDIVSEFDNINCIGDSLTASRVTAFGATRDAYKTYPEALETMSGVPTTMFAQGGFSSSDWWSYYASSFTSNYAKNLSIIYLGTNRGLTPTVATDCMGDDLTQYANNYTGDYGRILQTIKNANGTAVLVKCIHTNGDLGDTNEAIEQLAERFGFPCICVNVGYADEWLHKGTSETYDEVHFNDNGYVWLADKIYKQINKLSTSDKYKIMRKW